MSQNEIFFKKKQITNNDVELIFHRNYTWIYDTGPSPVVRYILLGCKNLEELDWKFLDISGDGITISTIRQGSHYILQMTDVAGDQFKVKCKRIIHEDKTYDNDDLTDLLKEANRKLDDDAVLISKLRDKIERICHYLEKELNGNVQRLKQADWLVNEKKQFLQRQNTLIQNVLSQIKQA